MNISAFAIEQFFAKYEFTTPYLLCASDCESMTVGELLTLAGRSLDDLGRLPLGYTESQGHPQLRHMIADMAPGINPHQVVVVNAPEEGIYLTMRTLLEPGDEVVVVAPAYASLLQVAEHICGREHIHLWPIEPTEQGWRLDLAHLESLITPKTKLLIVNFPHNPTGYLPTYDELETIVALAEKRGIWLFWDEMYRGLELGGHETLPSAAAFYDRCIVLGGLSKVHGLPGLRSGWVIIQDEAVRNQFINWKHYTSICAAAPSEFLALVALSVQGKLISRNRGIISDNVQVTDAFFARWPERFTWRRPQAGSVALLGVNGPSATAFCQELIDQAGILLLPGPYLGYDDQHVRLGLGRHNFAANLSRLDAYLQSSGD